MEINSGRLSFNPNIQSAQVSPSAVDLCLSNQFTVLHPSPNGEITHLDLTRLPSIEDTIGRHATEVTVPQGQCFTLEPKAFVLAYTREYVKLPNYLAARIEGRSSLAPDRRLHPSDSPHRPRDVRRAVEARDYQ